MEPGKRPLYQLNDLCTSFASKELLASTSKYLGIFGRQEASLLPKLSGWSYHSQFLSASLQTLPGGSQSVVSIFDGSFQNSPAPSYLMFSFPISYFSLLRIVVFIFWSSEDALNRRSSILDWIYEYLFFCWAFRKPYDNVFFRAAVRFKLLVSNGYNATRWVFSCSENKCLLQPCTFYRGPSAMRATTIYMPPFVCSQRTPPVLHSAGLALQSLFCIMTVWDSSKGGPPLCCFLRPTCLPPLAFYCDAFSSQGGKLLLFSRKKLWSERHSILQKAVCDYAR